MHEQNDHVLYTRNEWTNVDCFVKIINYLKTENIKIFVDIGSNVGEVSKIFLEEFRSLEKIYSYEPRTDNYEYLKNRFINEKKIVPIKKGIFYGKNESPLYFNGGCGSSTIAKELNSYNEIIELVELEKENILKPDVIKLDIEGSEYNVLTHSTLIKNTKYLIIEFHPFGMENEEEFEKKLPPVGFEYFKTRTKYINDYTDKFIEKTLPNFEIILNQDVQYFLKLKTERNK